MRTSPPVASWAEASVPDLGNPYLRRFAWRRVVGRLLLAGLAVLVVVFAIANDRDERAFVQRSVRVPAIAVEGAMMIPGMPDLDVEYTTLDGQVVRTRINAANFRPFTRLREGDALEVAYDSLEPARARAADPWIPRLAPLLIAGGSAVAAALVGSALMALLLLRRMMLLGRTREPSAMMHAVTWSRDWRGRRRRWMLVYPLHAPPDSLPVLCIPLIAAQRVARLPDVARLLVIGRRAPGEGIVLQTPDGLLWPSARGRRRPPFSTEAGLRMPEPSDETPLDARMPKPIAPVTADQYAITARTPFKAPVHQIKRTPPPPPSTPEEYAVTILPAPPIPDDEGDAT